jgi:hypothetical protein
MGAPKTKNPTELLNRQQLSAQLYLQGKTQTETASVLSEIYGVTIDQRTISNDLKAMREEWKKRSTVLINEHIAEEIAKIDSLERRYNQLYEKSTGKNRTRYGKLQYLQRVEWCIDRRINLLGIDAPKRMAFEGPNGGPIKLDNVRERFASKIAGMSAREQAAGTHKPTKR